MSDSVARFLERLRSTIPGVVEEADVGGLDPEEAALPYVVIGDLTRWATSAFLGGRIEVVKNLLDFLEREFDNGNEEIRELIAVGFVEMMPSSGEPAAAMRSLLGPSLAEEFARMNW